CFRFFFQAEDGIRDFHVTGVQTCALPICLAGGGLRRRSRRQRRGPAPRRPRPRPGAPARPGRRSRHHRTHLPPDDERRRPVTDMTSRYRAAWRSARRRARTWRHEADQYQRVADACRRALYRDDVPTDIDVEEEVRDAIAAVGIEWDTPHGETPADLVDAIVNHTRPALAKTIEQRNRYRAAWRSARRRARQHQQTVRH